MGSTSKCTGIQRKRRRMDVRDGISDSTGLNTLINRNTPKHLVKPNQNQNLNLSYTKKFTEKEDGWT